MSTRQPPPMTPPPPSSPPDRIVDWCADLPDDVLACVFQHLDAPSSICFRAVCRSWRVLGVVHDPRRAAHMPPPWVVIPGDIGCTRSFTLLSIPTQQGFRWTPPGGAGLRFVGSNGGWLAGAHVDADRAVRISLVNPLTNARVEVPALGRVSFVPHHERHKAQVEKVLAAAVRKVVFSPNPTDHNLFVAVVGVSSSRVPCQLQLSFGKAGSGCDEGWWCAFANVHDDHTEGCSRYSSVPPPIDLAYHGGKFYYMTTQRGEVWVVDMAAPSPSPARLARFEPTLPRCVSSSKNHGSRYHLAFCSDGALHVVGSSEAPTRVMFAHRYGSPFSSSSSSSQGEGSSEWTAATRLRGQCFLVGDFNQTLCVPAGGDNAWLRPDSVYFTNIPLCSVLAGNVGARNGVWRFRLDTGHIGRPECLRKLRVRKATEFWRPAWCRHHKDDLLEQEIWNHFKSGLDWSKAVWFMPSMT